MLKLHRKTFFRKLSPNFRRTVLELIKCDFKLRMQRNFQEYEFVDTNHLENFNPLYSQIVPGSPSKFVSLTGSKTNKHKSYFQKQFDDCFTQLLTQLITTPNQGLNIFSSLYARKSVTLIELFWPALISPKPIHKFYVWLRQKIFWTELWPRCRQLVFMSKNELLLHRNHLSGISKLLLDPGRDCKSV